jgi:hypothetical protein
MAADCLHRNRRPSDSFTGVDSCSPGNVTSDLLLAAEGRGR